MSTQVLQHRNTRLRASGCVVDRDLRVGLDSAVGQIRIRARRRMRVYLLHTGTMASRRAIQFRERQIEQEMKARRTTQAPLITPNAPAVIAEKTIGRET